MQNNRLKGKSRKLFLIVISILIIAGIIYPLLIIYTVRTSGKEFVKVMNSHDLNRYDRYFLPDTIFIVNGKRIRYSDVREKIVEKEFYIKEDSFYAPADVPFDTEYVDYFKKVEFQVGLHGGIVSKYGENNNVEVSIDGILVLKRYGLVLRVEEVSLNDVTDKGSEQYKVYDYIFSN